MQWVSPLLYSVYLLPSNWASKDKLPNINQFLFPYLVNMKNLAMVVANQVLPFNAGSRTAPPHSSFLHQKATSKMSPIPSPGTPSMQLLHLPNSTSNAKR
jgi:hypothetical protein